MLVVPEENRKQEGSPWQLPRCLVTLPIVWGTVTWTLRTGGGPYRSLILSWKENLRALASYSFQPASGAPVGDLEIVLSSRAEYQVSSWTRLMVEWDQDIFLFDYQVRVRGWRTLKPGRELWFQGWGRWAWQQRKEAELAWGVLHKLQIRRTQQGGFCGE